MRLLERFRDCSVSAKSLTGSSQVLLYSILSVSMSRKPSGKGVVDNWKKNNSKITSQYNN